MIVCLIDIFGKCVQSENLKSNAVLLVFNVLALINVLHIWNKYVI